MDGTVNLQDDGGYVATQIWAAVSKAITYSSTMMSKLFGTIGATGDEILPFCCSFSSPDDLRNEFIWYLAHTYVYNDVQGNSTEQASGGDDETEDAGAPTQEVLLDRIKSVAEEMKEADDVEE
eukprot:8514571-Ditylum_brightwellii.AAC.1